MTEPEEDSLPEAHHEAKRGFAFAHFALICALVTPLFLLACMMLTHMGVMSNDLGFRTLTLGWGARFAAVAMVISGLSLLISLFMAPRRCGPWALAAVAISGALLGGYAWYRTALKASPPIADAATDWDHPLSFSDAVLAARGKTAKIVEDLPRVPRNESLEWGGKTIADINALTCPGARGVLRKGISEDQIVGVLKALDYTITGRDHGRVEGMWQDNFYGFRSDAVVRIDQGRIDVRSVSRYDMPDMGLNCRHVTDIVNLVKALPDAADASASAPPLAPGDDQGGAD